MTEALRYIQTEAAKLVVAEYYLDGVEQEAMRVENLEALTLLAIVVGPIAAVLIWPWLHRRQRMLDAMRDLLSRLMANRNYVATVLLTPILLTSCETMSTSALPSSFTTENIMMVHQGMSSGEIQRLFGEPKSISSAVCGRPPNQWTCTTWEYGEFPYDRASFTFSGEHGSYILNNFDVDRD